MPTNTGEAREIKDRANANEAEGIRESKVLTRQVKAALNAAKRASADRLRRKASKRKK